MTIIHRHVHESPKLEMTVIICVTCIIVALIAGEYAAVCCAALSQRTNNVEMAVTLKGGK